MREAFGETERYPLQNFEDLLVGIREEKDWKLEEAVKDSNGIERMEL